MWKPAFRGFVCSFFIPPVCVTRLLGSFFNSPLRLLIQFVYQQVNQFLSIGACTGFKFVASAGASTWPIILCLEYVNYEVIDFARTYDKYWCTGSRYQMSFSRLHSFYSNVEIETFVQFGSFYQTHTHKSTLECGAVDQLSQILTNSKAVVHFELEIHYRKF